MFFQNNGGAHTHDDGKTYKKGDVIKTEYPLDEVFRGKFTRVAELPPVDLSKIDPDMPGLLKERQAQRAATMMKPARGDSEDRVATNGKATSEPPKAGPSDKAKAKKSAALVARGEDATEKFKKVADEGFVVFKREKSYFVYEPDSATPLNEKALAKDDVDGFVKDYLET